MSSENYDHMFKLLLIGDSGVDFKIKFIQVNKKKIKLSIWDTAGQERFRTLTSSYYRGAHGIILVYDISSKASFDNLQAWLAEADAYKTFPDIVKLVVGNKKDLNNKRQVSRAMGEEFARTHGMLFIECSAKTSDEIDHTFDEVARKILETPSLLENSKPIKLGQDLSHHGTAAPLDLNQQEDHNAAGDAGGWCCN